MKPQPTRRYGKARITKKPREPRSAKALWPKEAALNRTAAFVYSSLRPCAGNCGQLLSIRIDDTAEVRRIMRITGVSEDYARSVAGLRAVRAQAHRIDLARISVVCARCRVNKSYLRPSLVGITPRGSPGLVDATPSR